MGISIGNALLKELKLGDNTVYQVYLGDQLVWPTEDNPQDTIDLQDLYLALSCISLGKWIDELPWSDTLPWMDQ